MRTKLRSRLSLLFLSFALMLALPAMALADIADTDADAAVTGVSGGTKSYKVGDPAAEVKYWIKEQNAGGFSGCDVSNTKPGYVTVNVPQGVSVSSTSFLPASSGKPANTLKFVACGDSATNAQTVKFTANAQGNYSITAVVEESDPTSQKINNEAAFTLVVSAATITAPADTTAPTSSHDLSSAANANGWHNQNVTVTLNGEDNQGGSGLNGIDYSTDGGLSYTSYDAANKPVISTEGTTTFYYYAVDNSGNQGAVHSFTVKLDKTAPLPNCGSASANWLGADASIACEPTDSGGSGLASTTPASFNLVTNVAANTEDANASTNSRSISDAAGNTATAGPIAGNKVDKKAPSFLCDSPDGLWHASNVSLGCTATDGGSGLNPASDANFNLSTSVTSGTETANASTGTKVLTDAVGNTVTAPAISGNKIDMKVPGITLTTPAANAAYTLNQVVNADYNCYDYGSGLASCLGTVNNGSPINTSTIGTHSFKVDAEDNVANPNSVSRNYSVAAAFHGFLQPIDGNLVNAGKFGRVYPVKWQLRDASGALLSDEVAQSLVSSMTVTQRAVICDTSVPLDALETEAGAAGSTTVRYDAASDQFIFNYKAPSSGSCYTLNVNKADGVNTKSILFKFTK